ASSGNGIATRRGKCEPTALPAIGKHLCAIRPSAASAANPKFARSLGAYDCELRVQERHWSHRVASVLSIPKFAQNSRRMLANFGIGTLAGRDTRAARTCQGERERVLTQASLRTIDRALADALTALVARAADAILAIAPTALHTRLKADRSPVTAAD